MASKPKSDDAPPPLAERSDRLIIRPSRKEINPFSDTAHDAPEEPYLPPEPGPLPPMEEWENSDEERPAEAPEQTGDRPVFP